MELENEVSRMIWEGSPVPAGCNPTVKNSRFPESVGRTRFDTALEIAAITCPTGQPEIDPVVLRSVGSMDGRE